MILAADNIHGVNPTIAEALRALDPAPIRDLVMRCEQNGAQYLDLNPGYLPKRREDRMAFLVETVQEVSSLSLILDSPNASVLRKGLAVCREKPILNGVSLEEVKVNEIIPLAAEHGTDLVLLLMDGKSFTPPSTEEKIALAIELREHCISAGIEQDKLLFDPILPNLSWDDAYFRISEGLRTVRLLSSGAVFQEPCHTVVGLSNLRSGHSERFPRKLDDTCLGLYAGAGLKLVLANALRLELMATLTMINRMS